MIQISEMYETCATRHTRLCPRQVLGVRMGIAGLGALGIRPPVGKPSALIIAETDGCFVDGIEVATGATVGHRTLRIADMGKIAATFVDVRTARALRLFPWPGVRSLALTYAPGADELYTAQLEGYQVMPEEELFCRQDVVLEPTLTALLSNPDARVTCSSCGEEIINERERICKGEIVCRSCAGEGYYSIGAPR